MSLASWKLPFTFEANDLKKDLDQIGISEWVRHFNTSHHDGGWAGVALRSSTGSTSKIYPDPGAAKYSDTPLLERCPAIGSILSVFHCALTSVRLLRLNRGTSIHEHVDEGMGPDFGLVRIHVPVVTNDQIEFYLNGNLLKMKEGECWYVDFGLPHRVNNLGETDRIHLVLDCSVNDWLRSMIPFDLEHSETLDSRFDIAGSSQEKIKQFCLTVLRDRSLQERLRIPQDNDTFIKLAQEIALECGCRLTYGDIRAAMCTGKSAFTDKWLTQ
jgi:hypothetical protein